VCAGLLDELRRDPHVEFRFDDAVREVNAAQPAADDACGSPGYEVLTQSAHCVKVAHVFWSGDMHRLARALPSASTSSELDAALRAVQYSSVTVVNVAFQKRFSELVPHLRPTFGYLIPPRENQQMLGVTFDSCAFPEHDRHQEQCRFTAMMPYCAEVDRLRCSVVPPSELCFCFCATICLPAVLACSLLRSRS
jgi:protoporphyrinogen oxidase